MQIRASKPSGFCFGVKRALKLTDGALKSKKTVLYSLGPIIHNPRVVERLTQRGLRIVKDLKKIKGGRLIITSHGASGKVVAEAKRRGIRLIDTTCPYVVQARKKAERLAREGYQVLIFGDRNHPEIKALSESLPPGKVIVLKNKQEAARVRIGDKKVGLLTQTTQVRAEYLEIIARILKKDFREVRIFDTICSATTRRQQSARKITREVELVIVLGGRNSANTSRLAQICREAGVSTVHVERPNEIKPRMLRGKKRIGLVAGASTPRWLIDEAKEAMKQIAHKRR